MIANNRVEVSGGHPRTGLPRFEAVPHYHNIQKSDFKQSGQLGTASKPGSPGLPADSPLYKRQSAAIFRGLAFDSVFLGISGATDGPFCDLAHGRGEIAKSAHYIGTYSMKLYTFVQKISGHLECS